MIWRTILSAVQAGQLELNVLTQRLWITCRWLSIKKFLTNYIPSFLTAKCVRHNRKREQCSQYLEKNPSLATTSIALRRLLEAAKISQQAQTRKIAPVKEIALEKKLLQARRDQKISAIKLLNEQMKQ